MQLRDTGQSATNPTIEKGSALRMLVEELRYMLERLIASDIDKLPLGTLYSLSDLSNKEMEEFRDAWGLMEEHRRQALVQAMVEMAENQIELDFRRIFRWLLHDADPEVRRSAIEGLWEDERRDLPPILIRMLQMDESEGVRAAAATSLGRFILLHEMEEISDAEAAPIRQALFSCIGSHGETVEVRRRAIEAIAYSGDPEILEIIEDAYYAPEEKMRVSAIFAMGRNASRRWQGYVMRELHSPSPEMRYEAAIACGELELRHAFSRLVDLTADEDAEVREAAVWALGHIHAPEAANVLQALKEGGDDAMSEAAADALEELSFSLMDEDLEIPPVFDEDEDLPPYEEESGEWGSASEWDWMGM